MAFAIAGLKRISHGGALSVGPGSVRSIWHYITNDDAATVETANYFDPVIDEMRVGDLVFCSLDIDGTPKPAVLIIATISGGHVTVSGAIVTT